MTEVKKQGQLTCTKYTSSVFHDTKRTNVLRVTVTHPKPIGGYLTLKNTRGDTVVAIGHIHGTSLHTFVTVPRSVNINTLHVHIEPLRERAFSTLDRFVPVDSRRQRYARPRTATLVLPEPEYEDEPEDEPVPMDDVEPEAQPARSLSPPVYLRSRTV
ncbi:MAG: hypothetical protein KGL39_21040 [Patescibacteria group bacterium]|nr:hypothetical protein [Patescibacteria group bacterium]